MRRLRQVHRGRYQKDSPNCMRGEQPVTKQCILVRIDGTTFNLNSGVWDAPFHKQGTGGVSQGRVRHRRWAS